MNVLELLKDILLFALKVLYWFFAKLNVYFLGWEIFPGFKLYYILGIVLAYYIGKKWLAKILMSPVSAIVFLGNLLLDIFRAIFFKLIPEIWNFFKNIFRGISSDRTYFWLEGIKERVENFWYRMKY